MSENSAVAEGNLARAMSSGGSPARIEATEEGMPEGLEVTRSLPGPSQLEDWGGVLECSKRGPGSGHSDWEMLGPSQVSQCGSSPRTLSESDMEGLGPEQVHVEINTSDEEHTTAVMRLAPVEHHLLAVTEGEQVPENNNQVSQNPQELTSRPGTPLSHGDASIRSSTYSRVSAPSSPLSYHFSPYVVDDHSDSDWSSDNEGEGLSGRGRPRSEPDSEQALRDLEDLSQEGSLDGLSDSEASLTDPVRSPDMGVVNMMPFEPPASLPASGAGSFYTSASVASELAPAEEQIAAPAAQSDEEAVIVTAVTQETEPEIGAQLDAAAEVVAAEFEPDTPAVKVLPKVASHGGLPGLPGLKGMSGPGKGPVSYVREAVRRMWEWLKGFTVKLHNALPNIVPQRHVAVVRGQMQCLRACWEKIGWPWAAAGAVATVMGALLVFVVARNRQLARALHSKETEMTRLLIKVFSLQEKMAGARRIPIIRHTSHSKCSFGTFASTASAEYL